MQMQIAYKGLSAKATGFIIRIFEILCMYLQNTLQKITQYISEILLNNLTHRLS